MSDICLTYNPASLRALKKGLRPRPRVPVLPRRRRGAALTRALLRVRWTRGGSVSSLQLLDTFPAFERYWRAVRTQPLEVQIDRWEHGYMAAWPELLEKQ